MVNIPAKPLMTESEIALFAKWIPFGGFALEFGCGGSSRFFFEKGVDKLVSVEGDKVWGESLLQDRFLSFFIQKKRFNIYLPFIGPIQPNFYSTPAGHPSYLWVNYHTAIWELIDGNKLDFILIDGRFRLACALQSILHCHQKPYILIHDFWNRNQYHPILNFMDVIDKAETSVVLKQKDNLDWRNLCILLQKVQFDPA